MICELSQSPFGVVYFDITKTGRGANSTAGAVKDIMETFNNLTFNDGLSSSFFH